MDKLHIALIEELQRLQSDAVLSEGRYKWWQEEKNRADALEQENITLKASITELEELLQDCCENTRS